MSNKLFGCYIIGEDSLTIQCADAVLERGHELLGIVSSEVKVKNWALKQNVPVVKSANELLSLPKCDYLFSIVNSEVLPHAVLIMPSKLAINYHDAPLPLYAGVHATSWAILNGEKHHGITWHVMTDRLDAGDILKQSRFELDGNETALDLNLKCYEHAIKTFCALLDELAVGQYTLTKQNSAERSYYGTNDKPSFCGFINWSLSACEIDRLYRALTFGHYPNRLASPKFILNGAMFVVQILEILDIQSVKPFGTITALSEEGIQIATKTLDVLIRNFTDCAGNNYSCQEFSGKFNISVGCRLPILDKETIQCLITSGILDAQNEKFWRERFEQFGSEDLSLLAAHDNNISDGLTKRVVFKIDESVREKVKTSYLKELALHEVMFAVLLIYFYRVNNYKKLTFYFNDGHIIKSFQKLKFSNNLDAVLSAEVPCSFYPDAEMSFLDIVECIRDDLSKINKHKTFLKDISFRYPSIQTLASILSIHFCGSDEYEQFFKKTNSLIKAAILADQLEIIIEIDPSLMNEYGNQYFFHQLPNHLNVLLNDIIENPKKSIKWFSLLTYTEQNQLLVDWNQTQTSYPLDNTIHQLFDAQAVKTPNRIALIDKNSCLTYQELKRKSDLLAAGLSQGGLKQGDIAAAFFDCGIEMIIAILSILKAGAACLPMDIRNPHKRIGYMLTDANVSAVLTRAELKKNLKECLQDVSREIELVCIDSLEASETFAAQFTARYSTPKSLAYIIYTSGSTGQPKGVLLEHHSMVNMALGHIEKFNVTLQSKVLCFATPCFDVFAAEWSMALLSGAQLHIISNNKECIGDRLVEFLQDREISVALLPHAVLQTMPVSELPNLKTLVSGGEPCLRSTLDKWSNNRYFINAYGLTETSVCSVFSICNTTMPVIAIGKPMPNVKVYVLDDNLNLLPIGVAGELCIAGEGTARGYLNLSQLTKEKFAKNPFAKDFQYIYKTGDLVRWLPDGQLEFFGRLDRQIKLRGYRIELGEIEMVLSAYPCVKRAVVDLRKDQYSDPYLCAYLVLNEKDKCRYDEGRLREDLKEKLPQHMLPSFYMVLEEIPLTSNGKVDFNSLPCPNSQKNINCTRDGSKIRDIVIDIWQKLLNIEKIDADKNLFDLGAHSLLALKAINILNERLDCKLSIVDIFTYPTVNDFINYIHKRIDAGRVGR